MPRPAEFCVDAVLSAPEHARRCVSACYGPSAQTEPTATTRQAVGGYDCGSIFSESVGAGRDILVALFGLWIGTNPNVYLRLLSLLPWSQLTTLNKSPSTPHCQNVCLRRYSIRTLVHGQRRPLGTTNTNYNITIRIRLFKWPWPLTFDLWPWKHFQQCPVTWWTFLKTFIEIPPLSTERARHAK